MATPLSRVRTSTKIAGGIPLAILALFYVWAGSVRVIMGGFPDPGTLPKSLSTLAVVVGLPLVFMFPLAALSLLLVALSFFPPLRRWRGGSLAFACSAAVAIAVLWLDPWELFRWFMD